MSTRSQGDGASAGAASAGVAAGHARRIVALYLPELLCELAREGDVHGGGPQGARGAGPRPDRARGAEVAVRGAPRVGRSRPFAVVLGDLLPTARLAAVSAEARRLGLTEGQTIAEARAVVAGLEVLCVSRSRIRAALAAVAEVALGFGITTSIEPPLPLEGGRPEASTSPGEALAARSGGQAGSVGDTVWVDVTGTEGLFGGEQQLLVELASAVSELGHAVRLGIAEGPLLARALARWGVGARRQVGVVATPALVAALPVVALPLDLERAAWLNKLGVHTLGELAALPRTALTSRLAEPSRGTKCDRNGDAGSPPPRVDARLLVELCRGLDPTPLVPYRPPRILMEEVSFEDPVPGVEPLKFALLRLTARLAARLAGRGEAALTLAITLLLDPSVARLAGAPPGLAFELGLAAPLWREQELYRAIVARIERLKLPAPTVQLRLSVPSVTERATRQLDLSRMSGEGFAGARDEDVLPVLLAELAGDVGADRVGLLRCVDSHRPEAQTLLVSPGAAGGGGTGGRALRGRRERSAPRAVEPAPAPTPAAGVPRIGAGRRVRAPVRLFSRPLPFTAALRPEAAIFVAGRAYTIARVDFERRLEAVEWWSHRPTSRDYYRLLLLGEHDGRTSVGGRGEASVLEVLVYVDRGTGERYLQGIFD